MATDLDIQTHPIFTSVSEVNAICVPLFKNFDLTYFAYTKLYADGKALVLSSNGLLCEHSVKNNYFKIGAFSQHPSAYQSGLVYWQDIKGASEVIYAEIRELFHIDNGLSLIRANTDNCEIFHFGAGKNMHGTTSFYLSHLQALHHFCIYFKQCAIEMIEKYQPYRISTATQTVQDSAFANPLFDMNYKKLEKFFSETQLKKFHLTNNNIPTSISRREIECLIHLASGKNAKQISQLLNLSYRTIESYFENIKIKLDCHSNSELRKVFADNRLVNYQLNSKAK